MSAARFSIGIDLGTTNSALAYAPLNGDAAPETLPIQQWETPETLVEVPMLPSFLYLPEGWACPTRAARWQGGPGVDCRPSCPAQSGGNVWPRGALCQVLVVPSYGGPRRADPALGLGRYRTGPEDLAGARLGFDLELSARGLEQPLRRLRFR